MTENPNQNNTESSSAGTENTGNMIPKERFNEVNRKNKELQERLEALEKTQTEREESARKQRETELAEQNQYKQLYEDLKAELESLKPLQSEVKRYRDSFESTLQARIQSIPEDKRALIPEYDDPIKTMAWLDKALPELTTPPKPNAPRLDGGSGGTGNSKGIRLTPDQLEIAKRFGMSAEEYAKSMNLTDNN